MDFFSAQDTARKTTFKLVVLFGMAVLGIATLIYLFLSLIFEVPLDDRDGFIFFFCLPIALILSASFYKILQLGGHGGNVAEDLGGRYVEPDTEDPAERRLLNVVEEMSIASGIPVPEVYTLPRERSINAFAAGNSISEAAIGITQGCVDHLNRDELQGIIAHEFSHILNGDIRINTRLIGLLYGISIVKMFGHSLTHFLHNPYTGGLGPRYSTNAQGDVLIFFLNLLFFIIGCLLWVIGGIGSIFAAMIKAAISRQREFLADASAVQFTRNPDGIGNALRKIGGHWRGSRVSNPWAEEASHMFFARYNHIAGDYLATHPPLEERIKRVKPDWDGKFIRIKHTPPPVKDGLNDLFRRFDVKSAFDASYGSSILFGRGHLLDPFAMLSAANIANATRILFNLPNELHQLIHNRKGSKAVVLAMLTSTDPDVRKTQNQAILSTLDSSVSEKITAIEEQIHSLNSQEKIALIELAISTIRNLPKPNIIKFIQLLKKMVDADGHVDLFEFMLQRMVRRHLEIAIRRRPIPTPKYRSLNGFKTHIELLLSTLAHVGSDNDSQRLQAFSTGKEDIACSLSSPLQMQALDATTLERIDQALNDLEHATSHIKKIILRACAKTVSADKKLSNQQAELIRAIGDGIGCPVPALAYPTQL